MGYSHHEGMQDFRQYQDGERHLQATRGAKYFFAAVGVFVLSAFAVFFVNAQSHPTFGQILGNLIAWNTWDLATFNYPSANTSSIKRTC